MDEWMDGFMDEWIDGWTMEREAFVDLTTL
jgi:hypothetical protein